VDGYGHGLGYPSAFDHIELWGRNKTPLFLIGHPYGVSHNGQATLHAIRKLGLDVSIHDQSWYGFGTVQVRVEHAETVRSFTTEANHATT
jgi:hypothetical protein